MYSEAEAARLLRVAPSTLHYWLEGSTRRGTSYLPIFRGHADRAPPARPVGQHGGGTACKAVTPSDRRQRAGPAYGDAVG